jgi:KDO2-lipid IV(A) lauroyltransferase
MAALVGPLPPRYGYRVARLFGRLFYLLSPKLRRILAHNIRHVLGPGADEENVDQLVRMACVNIAKGHVDLFRLGRLSVDDIRGMTQIEGEGHLREAMAAGKGVVVVTAHMGNVDLMAQIPVAENMPITGPVEHVEPERLFQFTLKLRQRHGLRLIPSDGPMIGLFKALRRGEVICLPCDRDIADNTSFVNFFGAPARLPDGPVRVALRTGAQLLPAFARRLPNDTFAIKIEPALELPDTGDLESDVRAGMEMVVEALERNIARQPEQWLVIAPVWPMDGKRASEGAAESYEQNLLRPVSRKGQ